MTTYLSLMDLPFAYYFDFPLVYYVPLMGLDRLASYGLKSGWYLLTLAGASLWRKMAQSIAYLPYLQS